MLILLICSATTIGGSLSTTNITEISSSHFEKNDAKLKMYGSQRTRSRSSLNGTEMPDYFGMDQEYYPQTLG